MSLAAAFYRDSSNLQDSMTLILVAQFTFLEQNGWTLTLDLNGNAPVGLLARWGCWALRSNLIAMLVAHPVRDATQSIF